MKQCNLCVAVATMLCIAPLAVSYAQSNNELFSLKTTPPLTFDDGKETTTGSFGGFGYEVIGGHAVAEGDMVLGRVDRGGNIIGNILGNSQRGLGLSRIIDRWENGVIPYQYSDNVSDVERSLAEQAIEHWNVNTSVSLVEVNDQNRSEYENYIAFESSNGCASYVGMIGGEQQLWISASCGVGSIIHEIGHAVGLFHEHTRSDRDNFISVNWDNIVPGKEFNFDVLNANVDLLGEYDYGSIMHYGERFFSNNNENTIQVLDGVTQIGQRDALSELDIQSVNDLYETDLALSVNTGSPSQDNELIADINVTNLGESGANGLSLSLQLIDGGSWSATSLNPGWDCVPNDTALNCERDTLAASATSVFSVVAAIPSGSASSLAVELTSNTFDTDLSNNGHNATVTAESINTGTAESDNGTQNSGGGFSNPTVAEIEAQDEAPATDTASENQQQASTDTSGAQTGSVLAGGAENIQQSSQPIVEGNDTVAETNSSETPAELGAALPEAEDVTPTSSSSGGALSPLGAIALFLLTFTARIRRVKHH